MTIITNNILADKPVYEKLLLENDLKSIEKNIESKKVPVTPNAIVVSTGTRSRTISHRGLFFYIIAALLGVAILAAGVFLAIFVFQQVRASSANNNKNFQLQHLQKQQNRRINFQHEQKSYRINCEVEMLRQLNPFKQPEFLQESVTISADNEYLSIPQWNHERGASILQSFQYRITAVLDHANLVCFIKPMNDRIQPPKNLRQLVEMFLNKDYIPKAAVVRQHWRARTPSLDAIQVSNRFGPEIGSMCAKARTTYLLEPRPPTRQRIASAAAFLPLCPLRKCKSCPPGYDYGRTADGCGSCNCIKERVQPEACLKMKCMCADERYSIMYNVFGCKTCQCFEPLIQNRRKREIDASAKQKFTQLLLPDTYVDTENPVIFELVVDIPEQL